MEDALKRLHAELGHRKLDRKAGISERRKVSMKWCEDQRQKLQKVYEQLSQTKTLLEEFHKHKVFEAVKYTGAERNIRRMLFTDECIGQLPEEETKHEETKVDFILTMITTNKEKNEN